MLSDPTCMRHASIKTEGAIKYEFRMRIYLHRRKTQTRRNKRRFQDHLDSSTEQTLGQQLCINSQQRSGDLNMTFRRRCLQQRPHE